MTKDDKKKIDIPQNQTKWLTIYIIKQLTKHNPKRSNLKSYPFSND